MCCRGNRSQPRRRLLRLIPVLADLVSQVRPEVRMFGRVGTDPVADRIGSVVVAALTRLTRGLVSELELSPDSEACPPRASSTSTDSTRCRRASFRRRIAVLGPARMAQACRTLRDATNC
jgi:mRNA interferase MazF